MISNKTDLYKQSPTGGFIVEARQKALSGTVAAVLDAEEPAVITIMAVDRLQQWPATWVGFDLLLLAFMVVTATLGFIRHHWLAICAFATGVLLLCDAWFDVMTAKRGDFALSLATALFLELPLAIVLIGGSLRIASLQVRPLGRMQWPAPWRRAGRSSRRSTRLGPI
jgi:hypothetical protein